jgi:hypothetical protein
MNPTTPGREAARSTITRTTITPAPGTAAAQPSMPEADKPALLDRLRGPLHGQLGSARAPYPGCHIVRFVMALMMSIVCLLTVGGAILVLLLWQQDRSSGVLTSQLERTWDLFDLLRQVERVIAFAILPVATAWIAFATVNVRRATGQRRNPVIAALSLPVGVIGAWIVGAQIVAEADDWVGEVSGFVLQAIFLAIPLLALERVAQAAEARHRPLRWTYLIGVVYVAHLQFLGGLSTIDQSSTADEWGRLGAYLVIGALIQVLGTLAANEAARAIEEGTDHRYQLRQKFGESLLAQAARG